MYPLLTTMSASSQWVVSYTLLFYISFHLFSLVTAFYSVVTINNFSLPVNLLCMFNFFNSCLFDSRHAYWAWACIHRLTLFIPAYNNNFMGLLKRLTAGYCMNLRMEEYFVLLPYQLCMPGLNRVSLDIRIDPDTDNPSTLIIDDSGKMLASVDWLGHCFIIQMD